MAKCAACGATILFGEGVKATFGSATMNAGSGGPLRPWPTRSLRNCWPND